MARVDESDGDLCALQPSICLLDFGGACRTGLEDAGRIRAVSTKYKILMIGVPDSEVDILECIERGAAGYLLQDASIDNLIGNVRAIAAGETLCSPRIASLAFSRVASGARQINEAWSGNSPPLTRREVEIVGSIEEGLSNKEIAVRFHIEISTVKNHIHNILDKLQLQDRRAAAEYAKKQGLSTSRI
ncbi:MAG TPA: response regulator transcription factor [Nitrospira sp.]|nr:response regulator transcription factor [Nitrospira sp.]